MQKFLNWGSRLLVFLVFAGLLYGVEYRQVEENGFVFDSNTQSRLMGTIRGANGGYPFYFYLGDTIDPGEIDPNYAYRWSNTADDYGIHILTAGISVIGRQFDENYRVNTSTPFKALFGLFLLTAFVFLWPSVPLPVSLSAVAALSAGIFLGPISLSTSAQAWGVTYMALLVGIAIVTATLPKATIFHVIFVILLSLLIGFAQFLRQESIGVAYATGLGMLAAIWFIAGVAYFVQQESWRKTILPLARRVSISAFAILMAVFLAPYILRGVYSWVWDTPYSKTVVTQHGSGLPLYVGTGYVSNPYNIAWLDPIGEIHAQLYKPGVSISHGNADFQATLQSAWGSVVLESPWLVVENMLAKARFLHAFLRNGETPYPSAFLYAEQSDTMRILYYLAFVVLIIAVIFTFYRKRTDGLFYLTAITALILGSLAGPLSGFPSYIAGPQGAILVIIFLLPAALFYEGALWEEISPRVLRQTFFAGLILVSSMVLLVTGFIGLKWQRYQNQVEKIRNADPLAEIQEREFRYGHYFNALSDREKEKIIQKLVASDDDRIFLPASSEMQTDFFVPQVVVLTQNQLHVIIWMGEGYPGPVNYINQARVYSLIQVCKECVALSQNYNYTPDAIIYTFLNDTDWNNTYRFLSFPVDAGAFIQAEDLLIGIQRILDWGGTATGFSYQVEDLASEKFE